MNTYNRKKFATIFGSSAPIEGSDEYQNAYDVGFTLAEAGFTLKTGGYYGTMEAASRGALEAGEKAIGIPFAGFDPKQPNAYSIPQKVNTLFDRMRDLIHDSELIIVLPGGLGTLSELSTVWMMMQTELLKPEPSICCIGKEWEILTRDMLKTLKIDQKDLELLYFFGTNKDFFKFMHERNEGELWSFRSIGSGEGSYCDSTCYGWTVSAST
ncbi:MAG: LOG family protein [Candidatus Gracilibacteria bacterium]